MSTNSIPGRLAAIRGAAKELVRSLKQAADAMESQAWTIEDQRRELLQLSSVIDQQEAEIAEQAKAIAFYRGRGHVLERHLEAAEQRCREHLAAEVELADELRRRREALRPHWAQLQ